MRGPQISGNRQCHGGIIHVIGDNINIRCVVIKQSALVVTSLGNGKPNVMSVKSVIQNSIPVCNCGGGKT